MSARIPRYPEPPYCWSGTTSSVNPYSLLVSLEGARLGHCGIASDIRRIFTALALDSKIDLGGLIFPSGPAGINRQRRIKALEASAILHELQSDPEPRRRIGRIIRLVRSGLESYGDIVRRHDLTPFESDVFEDVIWRLFFAGHAPQKARSEIMKASFHYARFLPRPHLQGRSPWPFAAPPKLDIGQYRAILFQEMRPVRLPHHVVKFVRYHDAIPVTDPDLVNDHQAARMHMVTLTQCARDSHFVCNSRATRNALLRLRPDLEPYAHVIPAIVEAPRAVPKLDLQTVVDARALKGGGNGDAAVSAGRRSGGLRAFVLAVAPLEPKKNVPVIVEGWARSVSRKQGVKLLIVGGAGWKSAVSERSIAPYLQSGEIVRLAGLSDDELGMLYRRAAVLVFPSLAEGFGLPPVEALHAGTPVIASNIPAFREVLEDAALYVDPYDPEDLATKLDSLVIEEGAAQKHARLKERSVSVLQKYQSKAVSEQWLRLLETAKPRR